MNDRQRAVELLTDTHKFPGPVMIKVIGQNRDAFVQRVVECVREQLELEGDPPFHTREARGGRHVAVTIEPTFRTAEAVLQLYAKVRRVEGVVLMM